MYKRNERLINAKIWQYLLPGILMSLALQLGNVVDTILVGNILGEAAMASIALVMPAEAIIQFTGYCLGIGGSIYAGILLGRRDKKGASRIFTLTFLATLFVGILIAALAHIIAMPAAAWLAKGGALSVPAGRYLFVSMLGAPIIGIGLMMISFLGVENHPELASAYLISSNVINLICDYILLKFTPLGTAGAALSTLLGFLLGMAVFVIYIRSPKRMIGFIRVNSPKPLIYAVKAGMPMIVFMIMSFLKALGLNEIIMRLIGDDGMAVYTVCDNVLMIVEMVTAGVIGIIPNIAGILYGQRDYFGIRALCRRTLMLSSIAAAVIFVLVMAGARAIPYMFGVDGEQLRQIIVHALCIFILCVPAYVWNKFLISYYESIERSKQASMITFLQNGIYVLPAALIGITAALKNGYSGINALALSFVVSEILTAVSAYIYRKIKYRHSDFYMLPKKDPANVFDITIQADMSEVPQVSAAIEKNLTDNGISAKTANLAAVAAEEMTVNCIKYGGKASHWIDISAVKKEDKLIIRIRDNGVPFDPAEYPFNSEDFDIHGIELAKAVSLDISYIRAIDMNNTVIKFDIQGASE